MLLKPNNFFQSLKPEFYAVAIPGKLQDDSYSALLQLSAM